MLCEASLGWRKGCIRFWGRLDQNSGFHGNRKPPLTYKGENDVSTFRLFFIRPFWKDHIWPWHIGLRWAIVAVRTTCSSDLLQFNCQEFNNIIIVMLIIKTIQIIQLIWPCKGVNICIIMLIMSPPVGLGDILFLPWSSVCHKIVSICHKSCPLCNSKTVWDIFMKLYTNVKQHETTCRAQES